MFEAITNPKVENNGRTFTAKEVAIIANTVAVMVGDPKPKDNASLYRKLLEYVNIPDDLHICIMMGILSAREALKDYLNSEVRSFKMGPDKSQILKEIQDFIKNINSED
ncbi:hypothetical protein [Lachnospira sp.]|uniref:hypothetical protein n=1 Tax=Lachnospira sp. TaxID=2049031 RepID=UPI0025799B43|nr:hypothetical protein [Lachnospira sp.]